MCHVSYSNLQMYHAPDPDVQMYYAPYLQMWCATKLIDPVLLVPTAISYK